MIGRTFDPETDIRKLQAFLAEMRHEVAQAAYFQFGDLMWRMHYAANSFDASTDLRIWNDEDGRIGSFAHYGASGPNPEFFLRPALYDSPMAEEMIAWTVARARADNASTIETSCIGSDVAKAAFLARAGFQQFDDPMVFMACSLDRPIPQSQLPDGYAIVSARERPDLPGVTGQPFTHEAYAAIRNAPGYREDLGLRVCYRGREIVAGAICWYDDIDNCGEFEPVGTVGAQRGKGLALAVMARTMENLRRLGADRVYVRTGKANTPAVSLYGKLGFTITDEEHGWALSI